MTRRRGLRAGRPAAFLLAAVAVAGCAITNGSATPSHSSPAPSAIASPPATTSVPPSPAASTTVTIDASLLDVLPPSVGGLDVVENPDGEAAALLDPDLPRVASAVATALAIEPESGDFAYAVVVRLLPGAFGETAYRDWRDSFDLGACSQADGVTGHAQTDVDGRTVYIGTCGGGLTTYHVQLPGDGLLVSISSLGDGHLGELVVEDLRP